MQDEQLAIIRRNINVHSYGVISGIMGARTVDTLPLRLRCECALPSCEDIIHVTLGQRRELRRAYPSGFIVVPSHADPEHDTIAHQADNYCVVEKPGVTQTVIDL